MGLARRRVRLALGAAAVTLCAACTSPAENAQDTDNTDAAGASTTSPDSPSASESSTTSAPPIHSVSSPGPLESRLYGDDLLIVSAETLPEDVVDQVTRLRVDGTRAVTGSELFSVGSFSVENKNYRIAAVDPDGYRVFAPETSAQSQEQWDRVAGGEIALSLDLQNRLPLDKHGYLEVGSGEDTHPIHVGAYADQVGTVDAVVNTAWGEVLGLPEDNALVINTGETSPQVVRDELEKLLDRDAMSITDLDAVAEYGLDPSTYQTVVPVGSFSDAVGVYRYTPIGGGRVAPDPQWVRTHIVTAAVPILGQVTCNKYMIPQLRAALSEIQQRGLADEIHPEEYAGCYYPRFIAGTTTLSNHSFGLALDLNVPGNQRGTVGEMDRTVVAIFKRWGFAWGGDWAYTDPMHFELARIVNPG